jgi:hypothetical protein
MSNIIAYPQDEAYAKKNGNSSSNNNGLLTELPHEVSKFLFLLLLFLG